MSKRFTDTEKWKKSLIKSMPAAYKLLWLYICDDCDHAGIWQVDFEVAQIRIGESIDEKQALKVFGNKIKVFDNGQKWFIPGFIEFQYGILNPKINAHASVIKLLTKYGMYMQIEGLGEPLANPSRRVPGRDQDKDMDKDQDKDKCEQTEILSHEGVVPEMLKSFTDASPDYFVDKETDFPALLWIANAIGKAIGLKKSEVTAEGRTLVMRRWGEMLEFISADKWYSTRSIGDLKKQWQSVSMAFVKREYETKSEKKQMVI